MSMMARFVAITPDQLAEIKDSPEMVEGLFTQNAGLPLDSPLDLVSLPPTPSPPSSPNLTLTHSLRDSLPSPRPLLSHWRTRRRPHTPLPPPPTPTNNLSRPSRTGRVRRNRNRRGPGYGPARFFAPAQVVEIAGALQSPGLEQQLSARFDAATMTQLGIYPGVWESDDLDWLIEAFRTIRDFYAAASQAEQAVVTLIE